MLTIAKSTLQNNCLHINGAAFVKKTVIYRLHIGINYIRIIKQHRADAIISDGCGKTKK